MIFQYNPFKGYFTLNYTSQAALSDTKIEEIRSVWKEVYADQPFEYFLLSTYYNDQFASDDRLLQLMKALTLIAIFLACFSLIGLSLFETSNSQLEVGIRKVFGASSQKILGWFLRKYLLLFLAVILIVSPLVYYMVSQWLTGFSYRIEVSPMHVLVPASGLLALSFITIGFHSIKISMTNPVKVLREK